MKAMRRSQTLRAESNTAIIVALAMSHILATFFFYLTMLQPEACAAGECVYFDEIPTCASVGTVYLCCDSDECFAFMPVPECRNTMCCGTRVYQ
jgi:hypothetical protein